MDILKQYKYPIAGGIAGLILALSFFTFGFFKTILLLILVILGIMFGLYLQKTGILEQFTRK